MGAMHFTLGHNGQQDEIAALFEATFAESEGAQDGALIRNLVTGLYGTTPDGDLLTVSAVEDETRLGVILFSRLSFAEDPRSVFMMAPVAVSPPHQRRGVGQALIQRGLHILKDLSVDVAVTYGDPAYYGKSGFAKIDESVLPAPLPLQYPEGWLVQNLRDLGPVKPFVGPSQCVPAFNNSAYW